MLITNIRKANSGLLFETMLMNRTVASKLALYVDAVELHKILGMTYGVSRKTFEERKAIRMMLRVARRIQTSLNRHL